MQSHIGVPVKAVDDVALALPERQPGHAVCDEGGRVSGIAADLRPAQRVLEKCEAGVQVADAEAEMIDALGDRLVHDENPFQTDNRLDPTARRHAAHAI